MTEFISNHPLKITVTTVVVTSLALITFGWKAASAFTEIKMTLSAEQKFNKEVKNILDSHGNRLTKVETILDKWKLDE